MKGLTMVGNAKNKRMQFKRKKYQRLSIHFGTKMQKNIFQRKSRSGKHKDDDISSGNAYRKVRGYAKYNYMP